MTTRPGEAPRIATTRGDLPPVDVDEIEMRWAAAWSESDDGIRREWHEDVAALIDLYRETRRIANRYYEEMVRRGESAAPVAGGLAQALDRPAEASLAGFGMSESQGAGQASDLLRAGTTDTTGPSDTTPGATGQRAQPTSEYVSTLGASALRFHAVSVTDVSSAVKWWFAQLGLPLPESEDIALLAARLNFHLAASQPVAEEGE